MAHKMSNNVVSTENGEICVGIHELIDWQIVQYRQAIDVHRIDLSKAEGRCVAWQEAEKDFSLRDRAALDENSRVEYCGLVCPSRGQCLVAAHARKRKKTEPFSKVG